MMQYFTITQTISAVPILSQPQLVTFLGADLVRPTSPAEGPVFHASDLARLGCCATCPTSSIWTITLCL